MRKAIFKKLGEKAIFIDFYSGVRYNYSIEILIENKEVFYTFLNQ